MTPALHAVSTAAATAGALLAGFALIVVTGANNVGDLVAGSPNPEPVDIGLGWGGITILTLAVVQAVAAFVALAFDTGLAQTRRRRQATDPAESTAESTAGEAEKTGADRTGADRTGAETA